MTRFARVCIYAIGGAAMIGLVGCSSVGNGYGGWYWQAPELPTSASSTSVGMNNSNSNNTHAKSSTSGQSSGGRG